MNVSRRTVLSGMLATSSLSLAQCQTRIASENLTFSPYATASEQGLEEIFLWPDEPPGHPPTNVSPDDPYHVAAPSMFAYVPEVANGCAILLCQGGGYRAVGRSSDVPLYWRSHGYTVFDLRYRLPYAGWSAGPDVTLQDAQRAMRIIKSRAAEYGIQPEKTGVMGYSSGGHMATYFSTAFDREMAPDESDLKDICPRPAYAAVGCPVVTLLGPFAHGGTVKSMFGEARDPTELESRSANFLVRNDTPPVFTVHAADDRVVPPENSILLFSALQAKGVKSEMHIFRNGGHSLGAGYRPGSPLSPYPDLMRRWIERRTA